MSQADYDSHFADVVSRLSRSSIDDYYNPYKTFEWPERIETDGLWMSRDLMTVAGTAVADELSPEQLVALSKWESIHFYSLNVHGIRELLIEVIHRIHTPHYEIPTPFFHHFIGEENEHMWFFAEFCLRYGGKIYSDRKIVFEAEESPLVANFLVFSRILIFERIVDYFNSRMGSDKSLHPTIQAINRIHHRDESRHIAFGGQLVKVLFRRLLDEGTEDEIARAKAYVPRYIDSSLRGLSDPAVYRDAEIADAFGFRERLLQDPAWKETGHRVAAGTVAFYKRIGALT